MRILDDSQGDRSIVPLNDSVRRIDWKFGLGWAEFRGTRFHLAPRPLSFLRTFVAAGRIDSSPVVVGERVYVGSSDGNLYAVHLDSGLEAWRFESGGPITASPAVAEGCLVIGTQDGVLYCFAAARRGGS